MTAAREDFDDDGWLRLTEDLEPYERFRYIVRHLLEAAIEDARAYATDVRLFEDLDVDDTEALRDHLDELDQRLQADEDLDPTEARFMCAAVDAAFKDQGLRSRCYEDLLDAAEPAESACDR